jgi:hypothetical protein
MGHAGISFYLQRAGLLTSRGLRIAFAYPRNWNFSASRIGRPDHLFARSENWAPDEHCPGVSSQLKNLIRLRHFDASAGKMCRELLHDVPFAVNEEGTFRAGLLLPSQQLRLIGMG